MHGTEASGSRRGRRPPAERPEGLDPGAVRCTMFCAEEGQVFAAPRRSWARPCSRSPPPEAARPRSWPPSSPCLCSLLPARLGRAARLAGALLLAPGARGLPPRSRGRARLRTARQAAGSRHRRHEADRAVGGRDPGARQRERDDRHRQRHCARRASRRSLLPSQTPRRADRRACIDPRVMGRRPRGPRCRRVGSIPSGVPSFSLPRPPLGDAVDLVPAVIGIFLVCFADGILTVRSFAGKQYQHIRATRSSSPSRG